MTRRVMVFEFVRPKSAIPGVLKPLEKREVGAGNFHQFGVDYEEFDTNAGNFSTAIVEMPDGTIKNVRLELIRFDSNWGG